MNESRQHSWVCFWWGNNIITHHKTKIKYWFYIIFPINNLFLSHNLYISMYFNILNLLGNADEDVMVLKAFESVVDNINWKHSLDAQYFKAHWLFVWLQHWINEKKWASISGMERSIILSSSGRTLCSRHEHVLLWNALLYSKTKAKELVKMLLKVRTRSCRRHSYSRSNFKHYIAN